MVCMGSMKAQFNVNWSSDYRHTSSSSYSNEGRYVDVDTIGGKIYVLSDVTSNLNPSGVVDGQTHFYTVLSQFDETGFLIESASIDVTNHSGNLYDLNSGFGLHVDQSGIFVGYTNYNAASNFDVNISKFDNQLNLLWNYKFNGATEDLGIAMKVSATGEAFAIFKSSAGPNIRHRIIKASAAGISTAPLYSYNSQPDFLTDFIIDGSNIYTTGYRLVGGVKAILVSCVTQTGTLLWSRVDNCGTATGDDFARQIIMGDDDYLYLTGASQGIVQHGVDAVVMKFDPLTGKKRWENFININLTDGGFYIANPDPNYVYVAWNGGTSVYLDQMSAGNGAFIRRITYSPIPVSPYSSLANTTITGMKMSKLRNIYLTGSISGLSSGQNFTASFMIRASFTGRGIPSVEYEMPVVGEPTSSFVGKAIALDESIATVYFLSDEIAPYSTHQQETVWLQSLGVPAMLRVQQSASSAVEEMTITAQPNPASDKINITSNFIISSIEISDINGKIVFESRDISSKNAFINVSDLNQGVYFIKAVNDLGNSGFYKIIRQ